MARSSKMQIARSTRSRGQAKPDHNNYVIQSPRWTTGKVIRLFGGFALLGGSFVAYDSLISLYGQPVVNLALATSFLFAVSVWLRLRFKGRTTGSNEVEENLARLESLALATASNYYEPVSARNSAIRQARELIVLRAALDNARTEREKAEKKK